MSFYLSTKVIILFKEWDVNTVAGGWIQVRLVCSVSDDCEQAREYTCRLNHFMVTLKFSFEGYSTVVKVTSEINVKVAEKNEFATHAIQRGLEN